MLITLMRTAAGVEKERGGGSQCPALHLPLIVLTPYIMTLGNWNGLVGLCESLVKATRKLQFIILVSIYSNSAPRQRWSGIYSDSAGCAWQASQRNLSGISADV